MPNEHYSDGLHSGGEWVDKDKITSILNKKEQELDGAIHSPKREL